MSVVQCLACQHESPATAKFCSECGGQLNLKLCKQCDAINERAWQRCHNCGAEFAGAAVAQPRSLRRLRALISVLAFGAIAGLAFYLYTEPNLNSSEVQVGRLPPAVGISAAKASAVPVSTSQQRVAKPSRAQNFKNKQSGAAAAGDSAVRTSAELPAMIASDVPQASITSAPAAERSTAKPAKPVAAHAAGGSAPNDFHFIAPPP